MIFIPNVFIGYYQTILKNNPKAHTSQNIIQSVLNIIVIISKS